MKKIFRLFLILIIAAAVFIAAAFLILNREVSSHDTDIMYTVNKGMTLNDVADDLYSLDIIRSSLFLKLYGRITGSQALIKSGTFIVRRNMTTVRVLRTLIEGQQVTFRITIPEGYTLSKIAEILHMQKITDKSEFLEMAHNRSLLDELNIPGDSAEGYLYPDTYQFPAAYPADKVIRYMVSNLYSVLDRVYPAYTELTSSGLYDKIKLASIIEREYRIPSEAPLMSSVFYNRLRQNHKLESCATVVYVMTELKGMDNPNGAITIDDTLIPSPYNTYRNIGLPPGPISNPGEVALNAAFFPEDSDYMFFRVVDPESGRHQFTKTYSEHLNVYQYSVKKF